MYLRDEMVRHEMCYWRYGFSDEHDHEDWFYNCGNTAEEIDLFLFGA